MYELFSLCRCPQLVRVEDGPCDFGPVTFTTGAIEPVWNIDPAYYNYEGCDCIAVSAVTLIHTCLVGLSLAHM
jgi:hypothetical protein